MQDFLKSKKFFFICGVAVFLILAFVWSFSEFFAPSNQPFVLIKDWRQNKEDFESFSDSVQWLHRQCHDPMLKKSSLGNPVALAAKNVEQKSPKNWVFSIDPNARFSDGSEVLAESFEKAFELRRTKVEDPVFKRIAYIKALDTKTFELEILDASNPDDVVQTLTSIWVTPLKNTDAPWTWELEVSAPCEGPFVPKISAFDAITLKRNKYWRLFDESLLGRVNVLARLENKDSASELFRAGELTYVDSSIDAKLKSDFLGKRNSFLEPAAWYLLVNKAGSFAEKLTPFIHHVLNRGELESVVTDGRFLKVMYGIVPWSFVDVDGSPLFGGFREFGVESLVEARKDLGIPLMVSVTEIKPYFNRALRIYSPGSDKISPLTKRFSERLKTNFNLETEVLTELPERSGGQSLDLAFVEVPFERDLTHWAKAMLDQHEKVFPVPKDIKSLLQFLITMVSQPSVVDEQTKIIKTLDEMSLDKRTIIPIGQFASAYLLSPTVMGVEVRGDPSQDPDISLARWEKSRN